MIGMVCYNECVDSLFAINGLNVVVSNLWECLLDYRTCEVFWWCIIVILNSDWCVCVRNCLCFVFELLSYYKNFKTEG